MRPNHTCDLAHVAGAQNLGVARGDAVNLEVDKVVGAVALRSKVARVRSAGETTMQVVLLRAGSTFRLRRRAQDIFSRALATALSNTREVKPAPE